jgi:ribosome assembly protein YihI (activator of Der GTPase)
MANMSYCRFHNTKNDLDDCLDALRDGTTLSKDEFRKCKQMFGKFIDFLLDEGVIEDEDGELEERLDEFFETINTKEY